jgi:hypothetical protein
VKKIAQFAEGKYLSADVGRALEAKGCEIVGE